MQNENVAMNINVRKQRLQTPAIPQWYQVVVSAGAAEQGSQKCPFQRWAGGTETKSKVKQKALAHSTARRKGIAAAGHTAAWGKL